MTNNLKINAVELLKNCGKSATEVAHGLDIRHDLVSRWDREFSEQDKSAFTGQCNPRDEEVARLKI